MARKHPKLRKNPARFPLEGGDVIAAFKEYMAAPDEVEKLRPKVKSWLRQMPHSFFRPQGDITENANFDHRGELWNELPEPLKAMVKLGVRLNVVHVSLYDFQGNPLRFAIRLKP